MLRFKKFATEEEKIKYEQKHMYDLINTLKVLNPNFGEKIEKIGELSVRIADKLELNSVDFEFAAYYANIGFMQLNEYLDRYFGSDEKKQKSEHMFSKL